MIKRLLSNHSTVGHGLAELRGLYGTGHGQHGSTAELSTRHAKLAVGAASTLAVFLFETHEATKKTLRRQFTARIETHSRLTNPATAIASSIRSPHQ